MRIVFVWIAGDGLRNILQSFVRVCVGPSIWSNTKV